MSSGGFSLKSAPRISPPQSVQGTCSTSSFSSQETIKASKFNPKTILKELVGGSGNNQSLPKVPKSERVYVSGRGGARKGPKSPAAYIGPSNAEKLDALLANSNRSHDSESLAAETATISSFATSYTGSSGSSESRHSNVTVKRAVKEVLGGGGNEHGHSKHGSEFVRSYGRGGSYRSPTASSCGPPTSSDIEILSEGNSDSSSLSIARNTHGLFFFGRGRRSSEDASDSGSFLVVGPGEGIIHPSAHGATQPNPLSSDSALTRSSMHKSCMSKISVKVAVKEVLGGGGNDGGEWKYIDVFYTGYGRGGEGARSSHSIRDLYDIFYPCPHYSGRHYWYHNPNTHPRTRNDSNSTISFPSISSDTSSVYAPSTSSRKTSWESSNREDEGDTSSSWFIAQAYIARPNDRLARLAHHDLATPSRAFQDETDQHQSLRARLLGPPICQDPYPVGLTDKGKGRAMSEGAEAIHSPELIHFRRVLQEERQQREETRSAERALQKRPDRSGTFQGIAHKASVEKLASRSVDHKPSHHPPPFPTTASIRYSYKGSSRQPGERRPTVLPIQVPPLAPLPAIEPGLRPDVVAHSLASALALVQARSEYIKNIQDGAALSTSLAQLNHEHRELRREREALAVRLESMKKEILQHEKTIEGLTWLLSNLPEHRGMQVIVDTEDSEIDDETLSVIREAEEELINGDSRSILNLDLSLYEERALPNRLPRAEPAL